jgi:hypothetical protein
MVSKEIHLEDLRRWNYVSFVLFTLLCSLLISTLPGFYLAKFLEQNSTNELIRYVNTYQTARIPELNPVEGLLIPGFLAMVILGSALGVVLDLRRRQRNVPTRSWNRLLYGAVLCSSILIYLFLLMGCF